MRRGIQLKSTLTDLLFALGPLAAPTDDAELQIRASAPDLGFDIFLPDPLDQCPSAHTPQVNVH